MADIIGILNSMDPLQLGAMGAAALGLVAFIGYKLKPKKKKKNLSPETSVVSTNDAYKTNPKEDFDPQTYTVDTEDLSRGGIMKPKGMNDFEIDSDSQVSSTEEDFEELKNFAEQLPEAKPALSMTSVDYFEEAVTYDAFGRKEEAKKSLRKAYEVETHQKEKIRLHVIYKTYTDNKNDKKLGEIVQQYPSFLESAPKIPTLNEIVPTKAASTVKEPLIQPVDSFHPSVEPVQSVSESSEEINIDELPPLVEAPAEKVQEVLEQISQSIEKLPVVSEQEIAPPVNPVSLNDVENTLHDLAEKANTLDAAQKEKDNKDTENFMHALKELGQDIHKESAQQNAQTPERRWQLPSHDIWVNFMSLNNGRMNMRNITVHLENAWGTKKSVVELQEKVAQEIGKDSNGNTVPWAVISVHPLYD